MANPNTTRFSAVVLDQPLSRQLRLIRSALPGIRKVGMILGPDSAPLATMLAAVRRTRSSVRLIYRPGRILKNDVRLQWSRKQCCTGYRISCSGRLIVEVKTKPLQKQLEQSVAWSSFLASGVHGLEDVSFAEFVRRSRKADVADKN
ncbi:MAG: hypothetical protein ACREV0_07765 [Burkholderiales bacterium]